MQRAARHRDRPRRAGRRRCERSDRPRGAGSGVHAAWTSACPRQRAPVRRSCRELADRCRGPGGARGLRVRPLHGGPRRRRRPTTARSWSAARLLGRPGLGHRAGSRPAVRSSWAARTGTRRSSTNMVTTLDHMSGGRAHRRPRRGVAGQRAHSPTASTCSPPGDRSDRFEESVAVVAALLRGGAVTTFDGTLLPAARTLRTRPAPVQERLPVLVAGGGERRTLPTAARYADVWHVVGRHPDGVRRQERASSTRPCRAVEPGPGRDPRGRRGFPLPGRHRLPPRQLEPYRAVCDEFVRVRLDRPPAAARRSSDLRVGARHERALPSPVRLSRPRHDERRGDGQRRRRSRPTGRKAITAPGDEHPGDRARRRGASRARTAPSRWRTARRRR